MLFKSPTFVIFFCIVYPTYLLLNRWHKLQKFTSWNQLDGWLRQLEALRLTA
jgi:hypothetical protein